MVVDDVAQGKLFQAFMAGSDLKVEMRNGSQEGTDATVKWSATVVCTALDLTADYDGVYEYSATFKVKGDLVKDKQLYRNICNCGCSYLYGSKGFTEFESQKNQTIIQKKDKGENNEKSNNRSRWKRLRIKVYN